MSKESKKRGYEISLVRRQEIRKPTRHLFGNKRPEVKPQVRLGSTVKANLDILRYGRSFSPLTASQVERLTERYSTIPHRKKVKKSNLVAPKLNKHSSTYRLFTLLCS